MLGFGTGRPADGCVVVVEDDPECVSGGGSDLALEGRQQRQDHVHAERLLTPGKGSNVSNCTVRHISTNVKV